MGKSNHTKVLQITGYPPPRSGWGVRVAYLKKEMEDEGDTCTVLNIGKSRLLRGRDFVPVFNGVDFILKVFRHRIRGYKIHMHLNGDSPKGLILSCLAVTISLLTFRRPLLTMHDGPVQCYFPRPKANYLTPIFKYIFGAAKYIICNHELVGTNIIEYGIHQKKVIPIPAFTHQYVDYELQELDKDLEAILNNYHPVIATYCAIRPLFFIEDALHAFHELKQTYPNSFLVFLGENTPENPEYSIYAQKVLQLIKDLDLEDSIYFTGDLEHDTFLTALAKSTVFMRTPEKDGVSSSVLEALALRIPVVAAKNPLRPPQVISYTLHDIDEMVNKLQYVIENYEQICENLKIPHIEDTIKKEIEIIRQA